MTSQFGWPIPKGLGCKRCESEGLEICACTCKLERRGVGRQLREEELDVLDFMERPVGARLREGFLAVV